MSVKLEDLNQLFWLKKEIETEAGNGRRADRLRARVKELEAFIGAIPDSVTRQIFRLRFESNLSWIQVSQRIGGGNTADGVKKICYRYLRRKEEKKPCRRSR